MSSDLTFITNEKGQSLADRFLVLLGNNTRFFDCLVGYFFISGFHRLYPALEKTEKVRILIGLKTDQATFNLLQQASQQQDLMLKSHAEAKERLPGEILSELEHADDTAALERGVATFLKWVRAGKLEMILLKTLRSFFQALRGAGSL